MKTTSKKRMLISSVAMLLVAMLALGTATFAWFTSSTSATTQNLSVKTIKSSELKISKSDLQWTDTLDYEFAGQVLKPASSANGSNWFTATAASKSAAATTADLVTNITSSVLNETTHTTNGYVFFEQLNVTNAGKADVDDVTISFTLSETQQTMGKKYLRLALVPAANGGANAANSIESGKTFANYVYSVGADSADAITGTEIVSDVNTLKTQRTASIDGSGNVEINIGQLIGDGSETEGVQSKYFNLYVWFEGQDADCYDAFAGNAMPQLTFTVSGNTASQTTNR